MVRKPTSSPASAPDYQSEAEHALDGVEGLAFLRFTQADNIRHPLVGRIVDAYKNTADNL